MPIFNFGGGVPYATPVLNNAYPANVTQMERADGSAAFEVKIDAAGHPDSYSYQWYVNDAAVSGATFPSYTKGGLTSAATYSVYCKVTNKAGSVNSRTAILTVQPVKPAFSYSGAYSLVQDSTYQWRLKFLTSGVVNFSHLGCFASGIDVFCVGGGGCGYLSGGAGGRTTTSRGVGVSVGTNYTITVGAGGISTYDYASGSNPSSNGASGGTSSAFGVSAIGGGGGSDGYGGSGGSGGGAWISSDDHSARPGNGGSDGSDGGHASRSGLYHQPGAGQGYTTREFGESGGTLYAGGGGGGNYDGDYGYGYGGDGGGGNGFPGGSAGVTNTGGGGGGGWGKGHGYDGGSGIVVIRDRR